ncbi:MAG: sugar phosphate isomerase/epimerase family protein [Sedimentisphaerales bacterium]|nr:sugar phosphate isomerase/epimerase family protein [Sedimentisphaerales bacterium]
MTKKEQTRRQFIKIASIGAAVSLTGARSSLGQVRGVQAGKQQFKLGLASYTLRKFNLDDTLAITKRVGLRYICFKSMHLPLDSTPAQIRSVVAKVKEAGLILYGGGVIYMRNQDQVHQAFDYAKAAGMKVIVGVPMPELLPLVDKKVKEYDIKVAIHNHGPGDKVYPTPASVYERVKDLDKRIGLCNDIGHTKRIGSDPAISAKKFADRLLDVHIKDVSEATAQGNGVEIGRGVIDIPEFLKMLVRIKYSGIVSFEYEKDADDPIAGLAESVGYIRGVLAAI